MMMMEAILSSETSVPGTTTRRHASEDGILLILKYVRKIFGSFPSPYLKLVYQTDGV
jgi:hypothetical protein